MDNNQIIKMLSSSILTSFRTLSSSCLGSDSAVLIYLTSNILLSNIFTELSEGLIYDTAFLVCAYVTTCFKYIFDVNYTQQNILPENVNK